MPPITLESSVETWPLKEAFVIARGAKTEARVVCVTARDGMASGRGECVPYARYGETPESVMHVIETAPPFASRDELARALPAGAARAALDCALWDLEAKRSGQRAADIAGMGQLRPLETFTTLSLDTASAMAGKARAMPRMRLLKLKLGGAGDPERMAAVRQARPDARLVADANESWTPDMLLPFLEAAMRAGIELVEQPLPANGDGALRGVSHAVPVCADESAHTSADLPALAGRYEAVNIKLDKAGGLTEALATAAAARAQGLGIMVGCMVATSLAMAPAFLVAQGADWVDLDGPLLLARDRPHALAVENSVVQPPDPELWG